MPDSLRLAEFAPRAQLRVPVHEVGMAKFAAIDAHSHLGRWLADWVGRPGDWMVEHAGDWLEKMSRFNVHGFVNLDGRWGDELAANLRRFDHAFPGRFATFAHVDWSLLGTRDGVARLVAQLEESVEMGAAGLKVWKDFGLEVRDRDGQLAMPDDPAFDELWSTAARLKIPIWWHIADPVAFFDPVDHHNENYELLVDRPEWSFYGAERPTFARLMHALGSVVSRHPETTFVVVHGGAYPENLAWVDVLLDANPNVYIDIAARLAQLGRQPRAARAFMVKHASRVLFGTDQIPPTGEDYPRHFRFLETDDEAFAHSSENPPAFGRWTISGLALPDDVLEMIYSANVRRLLPTLIDPTSNAR